MEYNTRRSDNPETMIQPISLPDPNKMSNLSVPRKSSHPFFPPVHLPASSTEMSMPSISFGSAKLKCAPLVEEQPSEGPRFPGKAVPGIFLALAVVFELGNALSPLWLRAFPAYAAPPLSLALFLQGLARGGWLFWASLALPCALPAFSHDPAHVTGYLLALCCVVGFEFWRRLRGVWLALVVLCVCGVACGAAVTLHQGDRAGLHVTWLSSLFFCAVCVKDLSGRSYGVAVES